MLISGDIGFAQPSAAGIPTISEFPIAFPGSDGMTRSVSLKRGMKAISDVLLAALMLVAMSPLLLLIAAGCRLDGGPALFAHRRIGKGGQPFPCLKFRTMVVDAERVLQEAFEHDPELRVEWAATRKLRRDPRVTWIGKILRNTSLDELPQLFNVLCLQMSLVGPRPVVESEVPLYGADITYYYAVRPGLTGLWQISGRSNTTYRRRVELDTHYVANWTLRTDVRVLLRTVPALLAREGAY